MIKKILITIFITIGSSSAFAATIPVTKNPPIKKSIEEKIEDNLTVMKRTADDDKGILTVIWENDVFDGSDRGYTNGGRISYVSSEENMPNYIRKAGNFFPLLNKNGKKRVDFALGQSMFTPSDTTTKNPAPNDRPYAGWLYAAFGIISDTGNIFDNAQLTLGVVGSASKAQQAQNYVHNNLTGSPIAQGWSHQLKNEMGINFDYERKWRGIFAASPFGMGFDVIPHAGLALGNVNTHAGTGFTLRFGYDLPADYGPPRIRPSLPGSDFFIPTKKLGGYLFMTTEARAVLRNIFLDGNTFQSSASVDKRYFVGSLQFGAAITYNDLRISFTQVAVSSEFKGPYGKISRFGAATISYRF